MLCNVTGSIYTPLGVVLEQGKLHITLQQDMILDGLKIVPTKLTVDLSVTSGVVDVNLYPTVGATPAGLAYHVEFDPDPDDTSKPMRSKTGYWSNYWPVPYQSSATIASFATALRGTPTYTYLQAASPAVGINPTLSILTSGNKVLTADDDGLFVIINTTTAQSVTLSPPAAGRRFVIATNKLASAGNHSIVVGSGVTIYGWNTSKTNAAFSQTSGAVGDWVEVVGENATTWWVVGNRGSAWT